MRVYKHLLAANLGFDEAVRALAKLRRHPGFNPREIDHFCAAAHEVRASVSSYVTGIIEEHEVREAGRLFGKRRERELREEADSG